MDAFGAYSDSSSDLCSDADDEISLELALRREEQVVLEWERANGLRIGDEPVRFDFTNASVPGVPAQILAAASTPVTQTVSPREVPVVSAASTSTPQTIPTRVALVTTAGSNSMTRIVPVREAPAAGTTATLHTPTERTVRATPARRQRQNADIPQGSTTARKNKRKKSATRIKSGLRCFVTRKNLKHLLSDEQKVNPLPTADSHRFFGTVGRGNAAQGFNVCFDLLPAGHKDVLVIRGRIETLAGGQAETQDERNYTEYMEVNDDAPAPANANRRAPPPDPYKDSMERFCQLPTDTLQTTKHFDWEYGDGVVEGVVRWEILGDTEHINTEPSARQRARNKSIGNPIILSCFVCRKYLDKDGKAVSPARTTSWWCKHCYMPLCNTSKIGEDGGRELSCCEEHRCSEDPFFACTQFIARGAKVPVDKRVKLWRGNTRRMQNRL